MVSIPDQRFAYYVGRDSAAGIATGYGLDGQRFKHVWGQEAFSSPYPLRLALAPTQPPPHWISRPFGWVKRQRHGVDLPRPSGAEVMESYRVAFTFFFMLYLSTPVTFRKSPTLGASTYRKV